MAFSGFQMRTTDFLARLAENNTREWFEAHRNDYEEQWVAPAVEFVEAAGEALSELNPDVVAEPRINGSIFRINRDVRFSKDKRPYKDHLDFWFWEGERRTAVSGYFVRLTPTELGIGVGAHGFDKERLDAYRRAVVDRATGADLERTVKSVEAAGWTVKGESYKRTPRGFDPADATQERLLRHGALWCGQDSPHPASLRSAMLIPHVMRRWQQLDPLHRWLVDTLG